MREFSKQIAPHLIQGLRPERRMDRNAEFLHEAFNVRIADTGMEPYRRIVDPFGGALPVDFPFPQLYIGEMNTLLLYEGGISIVNRATTPWTLSAMPYRAVDGEPGSDILPGGVWHIADMKDAFYLFNGETTVAAINNQSEWLIDRVIKINTGTHFRGRVVVGGIDPEQIWSRGWHEILTFWQRQDNMLPNIPLDDIGPNFVMWGSIGGGDFPLWLFDPEILHRGPIKQLTRDGTHRLPAQESYAMDRIRQGQFGFMPMPYPGVIYAVKPLGNGVMVYGSEGIAYMPHVSAAEPAPTFGLTPIMRNGIAGRGAVAGNEHMHVFVDREGDVWRMPADLDLKKLGYREWTRDLLDSQLSVSHDPKRVDFYISTPDTCFLLTTNGMSQVHQQPTSVSVQGSDLIGLFNETLVPEYELDDEMRIVTNMFDMNLRGQKTITAFGVGINTASPVRVAIDYRYSKSEEFKRTHFVTCNKEGNAILRIAGTEFRAVVHVDDYENAELDYIKVRWQSADKRSIRGVDDSAALVDTEIQ